MKSTLVISLTLITCFSSYAYNNESGVRNQLKSHGYLYGIGLGVNTEIYKGFSTRKRLIPVLGYKGERLSVYGPFISYKLFNFDSIDVLIKASPRFQGFEPSDSEIFAGMKKRHFSMDAGVGVNYHNSDWKISFSAMFDAFDRSNGRELTSSIGKAFKFGPLFFEPSISVSYLDANHVDYYYGVHISEINDNRIAYKGSSVVNYGVGMSFATPIFFDGFSRLSMSHTWFDHNIANSPLVDKDTNLSLNFIFTKFF